MASRVAVVGDMVTGIGSGARFTQQLEIDDAKRIAIYLMHAPSSVMVEIEPHLNICQAVKSFGNYILFSIIAEKIQDKSASHIGLPNAFDLLMKTRQDQTSTLHYPENIGTGNHDRGDWRLHADIIGVLKANNLGFRSNQLEEGKSIVTILSRAMFYVMPHLQKLKQRGFGFPALFMPLLVDDDTLAQEYNRPEKSKHIARLDQTTLNEHSQQLYQILLNPVLKLPRLEKLHSSVRLLATGIEGYLDNLRKTEVHEKELRQSLEPAR
jgi:hypothetical protein